MPQSVLVQVGQCGNQIGFNFWKSLLQEYSYYNELSENDFSQFLRPKSNVRRASMTVQEKYIARGILIDTEEGVINAGLRSSVGSLFLNNQILTDTSGSGNNWAVGHFGYGRKHKDAIEDLFRFQAESCDSLEAFLFVFSLSGGEECSTQLKTYFQKLPSIDDSVSGTGSGLGTYALKVLEDGYPKVCRIAFSLFPSDDTDDVIISPYNAALCNSKLLQHADVIVPFENSAMDNIFTKLESNKFIKKTLAFSPKKDDKLDRKPFNEWNSLIVATILDCTSTSRYPTLSRKSLRELTLNLAPEEYLKYAVPSIAPMFASENTKVERLFNDVISDSNSLLDCKNMRKIVCAATFFSRGRKLNSTAVEKNLNRLKKSTKFADWCHGGFQHGECQISQARTSESVVMLSNHSAVAHYFRVLKIRLHKMYDKKANLHHYCNEDTGVVGEIDEADEKLQSVIHSYEELKTASPYSNPPFQKF